MRQINLRDVPRNHRLGIAAKAGEKHLHLLHGGVLRLVEDDKGIVERAAAHVGERRHFNGAPFHILLKALAAQHVKQGVVERAQVGVDLALEVSGQKAQLLPRLNSRTGND